MTLKKTTIITMNNGYLVGNIGSDMRDPLSGAMVVEGHVFETMGALLDALPDLIPVPEYFKQGVK